MGETQNNTDFLQLEEPLMEEKTAEQKYDELLAKYKLLEESHKHLFKRVSELAESHERLYNRVFPLEIQHSGEERRISDLESLLQQTIAAGHKLANNNIGLQGLIEKQQTIINRLIQAVFKIDIEKPE